MNIIFCTIRPFAFYPLMIACTQMGVRSQAVHISGGITAWRFFAE